MTRQELDREIDNTQRALDRAVARGRKLGAKVLRSYLSDLKRQRAEATWTAKN